MSEAFNKPAGGNGGRRDTLLARWRKRCRRLRHALLPSTSYKRLADALPVSRKEVDALILRLQENRWGNRSKLLLLSETREMLANAQAALEEGNPELAWRWFKAASRSRVYTMADGELLAMARSILNESSDDKKGVTAWRQAAIKGLLADEKGRLDGSLGIKDAGRVAQAAKILDEHHDNVYQRLVIVRARLKVLAVLTAFAVAFWIIFLPSPGALMTKTADDLPLSRWVFWGTIFLAGVTGSIISGFTSSIKKGKGARRIPLELDFSTIMFARLALGALSALAVTAVLLAGLLRLGEPSYGLLLAAAIVSGFSERLLLRAIESAGG